MHVRITQREGGTDHTTRETDGQINTIMQSPSQKQNELEHENYISIPKSVSRLYSLMFWV